MLLLKTKSTVHRGSPLAVVVRPQLPVQQAVLAPPLAPLQDPAAATAHLQHIGLGSFFFWVGELFITSVKHTCSERTTRAMFRPEV